MDTILVVRPREVRFKWAYDRAAGTVSNTGNTWFKLLIKPGCDTTEEEGDAWYLRPGDVVRQASLRQPGNHYIIYNDKFINDQRLPGELTGQLFRASSLNRTPGIAAVRQQAQAAAQQIINRAGKDKYRQRVNLHPIIDLPGDGGQFRHVDDKRQRRCL